MSWDALQKGALLGTERQAYEGTLLAASPEAQLLSDAAALTLQRKAGRVPAARNPDDAPAPCPEDAQPAATYTATLRTLLETRTHSPLLAQWLDCAQRADLRAPEQSLPDLLEYGRHAAELRPAIRAVLGERGRWLARLNRAWGWALRPEGWIVNGEVIPEVRRREPARARSLTEQVWQEMSAQTRTEVVDCLSVNLSLADEPFLERALTDRSKSVRRSASRLLTLLPGSALSRRMARRADALLSLVPQGSKKVVTLNLLAQADDALLPGGIEPEKTRDEGERASLTRQVLEGVPLEHLTERFGEQPSVLIDAALENKEWGALILAAWTVRTVRAQNTAWARAFFEKRSKLINITYTALPDLFRLSIPAEERDAYLLAEVRRHKPPLYKHGDLAALLHAHERAWSPALTAAVLAGLPADLSSAKHYRPNLQSFYTACAHSMHPATLQEVLQTLTLPESANWIDTLLAYLRDVANLRRAILEEFR